jgi:kynurenine formamidase
MENLNPEMLARDRCYTFAFIGIPLKFSGATGLPVRPLALD